MDKRRRTKPLAERFWSHVDKLGPDDCWPWVGGRITHFGYAQFRLDTRRDAPNTCRMAHCLAYELSVGPVPEGMELGHICHDRDLTCNAGNACLHRRCCNPAHLKPMTHLENVRSGRVMEVQRKRLTGLRLTHCRKGHLLDEANTKVDKRGHRTCRTCYDAARAAQIGVCSVDGCERRASSGRGGMCDSHYVRQKKGRPMWPIQVYRRKPA